MNPILSISLLLSLAGPPGSESNPTTEGEAPADEAPADEAPSGEAPADGAPADADEAGSDGAPRAEAGPEQSKAGAAEVAAVPEVPLPTVRLEQETERPDESHPAAGEAGADVGPGSRRAGTNPDTVTTHGGGVAEDKGWHPGFNGYINAPMRMGFGKHPTNGNTTLHGPLVPDDQFLSWQHTSHMRRSWAELYLSYGNNVVRGTAVVEAFNFTDVNWNQSDAQFGIGQAFVTVTPRFRKSSARFRVRVGAFDNRYGMSGRYDLGQYETYIFGRTRAMGETMSLAIPVKDFTINLEHGVGVNRPNPSIHNSSRFTFLNHAHVGFEWKDSVDFNLHYLGAHSLEEDRRGELEPTNDLDPEETRGRMQVFGPELRIDAKRAGYWYTGFSVIDVKNGRLVGPAIEVIHAQGGGNFTLGVVDNYLEGPTQQSGGDGAVYTVGAQTEHSLQRIMKGDKFWGQGWDLTLKLYGMMNFIQSPDPDVDGTHKLKYGADLFYSALPWLGAAIRADRVQPHSDLPDQSFAILSPRLVFRSSWLTRETLYIQYSRYMYARRECDPSNLYFCVQPPVSPVLPDGWGAASLNEDRGGPLNLPDYSVITVGANIWW
jgi:hypothetical protein